MKSLRQLLGLCTLGAALGTAALPAAAQGSGPYFGISAGTTSVDLCNQVAGLGLTSCDDKDTGLKVFGGARVSPNFAFEIGWVDLGKVTLSGPGGTGQITVDGIQAAALGIAPVSPQVHLFGKLGFFLWDGKATAPGLSLTDDGTDIMFGFGVGWNITKNLTLRGEWENFDIDGDDVTMFSVGLQINF